MQGVLLQMATLSKAEALLEDLRSASWDAAVKDLDEVKAFAAKQVSSLSVFCATCHPLFVFACIHARACVRAFIHSVLCLFI